MLLFYITKVTIMKLPADFQRNNPRWRQFQVCMDCYSGSSDVIKLASDIDDMTWLRWSNCTTLKSVIQNTVNLSSTMAFNEWESISIDDDDPHAPI